MKKFHFYFILAAGLWSCAPESNQVSEPKQIDWQGHRGARGLMPENSIPGFLLAMEFPIQTLELDVVISKDSQVVVSHEPWISHYICSHADGSAVQLAEEEELNLFNMTYEQIQQFDCGKRGNDRFVEQKPIAAYKPTLRAAVQSVEKVCASKGIPAPNYNIEIKSRPEWDNDKTPYPKLFAKLVVSEIFQLGIAERACVQSFDPRSLREVRLLDSTLVTALLVMNEKGVDGNIDALGFTPKIYSPNHSLVTANVVDRCHELGMKVIPWTVNDTTLMQTLLDMDVDGIITDYPDRIIQ